MARTLVVWIALLALLLFLWSTLQSGGGRDVSFNDFQEMLDEGRVAEVVIADRRMEVTLEGGRDSELRLYLPFAPDARFVATLMERGVVVWGANRADSPLLMLLVTWGPILLIAALWIFFMRRLSSQARESAGHRS